jgi:outer membrane protein assembly factor BamB
MGKTNWINLELPFKGPYGVGVSPVLVDGAILVQSGGPENPYLSAVDARSGKTIWRTARRPYATFSGDNRTPVATEIAGRKALICWGRHGLVVYDVASGQEMRRFEPDVTGGDNVASISVVDGMAFLPTETGLYGISILRLSEGRDPVMWFASRVGLNCPSPVYQNGLLFAVSDRGIATCLDGKTGEELWRQRLDLGEYVSSAVAAGDYVYFTSVEGVTTVVLADRRFTLVARNDLHEEVIATPAFANGELYLRTRTRLYRIGEVPGAGRL